MWTWDWSEAFSWPGLIWGIITAVILPGAAIIFAVRIGHRQIRTTLDAQLEVLRKDDERADRDEARRSRERVADGGIEALEAMGDLVHAAFTDDFREVAVIRIRASRRLPLIQIGLGKENELVWDWIAAELAAVSAGLEDTDHLGLSRVIEQITWRAGTYTQAITDWLTGEIDVEWFRDREGPSLAETPQPVTTH